MWYHLSRIKAIVNLSLHVNIIRSDLRRRDHGRSTRSLHETEIESTELTEAFSSVKLRKISSCFYLLREFGTRNRELSQSKLIVTDRGLDSSVNQALHVIMSWQIAFSSSINFLLMRECGVG
jgi:hypothetical protein